VVVRLVTDFHRKKSKMARLPSRHSSPGKPHEKGFFYSFNGLGVVCWSDIAYAI